LRLVRSWNQTGDKWLHLGDVAKALNDPENADFLTLGVVVGLLAILWMIITSDESRLVKFLATVSVPAIYGYHAASAPLHFGTFCSRR
jgi:hypothetical protein